MNGRIPNDGSAAVDAHFVPNRNLKIPIFVIAGAPDITRKTVINSTNAIEKRPKIRKIVWNILSMPFCLLSRDCNLTTESIIFSFVCQGLGIRR